MLSLNKIPKNSRRIFGLLLIAVGFCSVRCNKDCVPQVFDAPPEVLRYFSNYRPGNWWAFRNDTAGRDSLIVLNTSDTFYRNMSGLYDFECKPQERSIDLYLQFIQNNSGSIWTNIRAEEDTTRIGIYGDIRTSLIYFPASGRFSLAERNRRELPIIDSIRVGSNTFRQVLPVPVFNGNNDSGFIWLAPEMGIVQYAISGDTFILDRWQVR